MTVVFSIENLKEKQLYELPYAVWKQVSGKNLIRINKINDFLPVLHFIVSVGDYTKPLSHTGQSPYCCCRNSANNLTRRGINRPGGKMA